MKNNDFDFINEKFNEAKIDVPKELDEKVNKALIGAKQKRIKVHQTTWFKTTVSLAACLVLFVSALFVINNQNANEKTLPAVSNKDAFTTFKSYEELQSYIKKNSQRDDSKYGFLFKSSTDKLAVDESISSTVPVDTATTYIQEIGVDEADIIKTYKDCIYTVSNDYYVGDDDYLPVVNITRVNGKNTEKIAKISFDKGYNLQEIYVFDDILVAIENQGFYGSYYLRGIDGSRDNESKTAVVTYDISNPEKPEKINTFIQSGNYSTSRIIKNNLYLVTNYGVNYDHRVSGAHYAPFVCKNGGEKKNISFDDIAYQPNSNSNDYVVVSAFDVKKGKQLGKTKALIGWGMNAYCSLNNLYVYSGVFNGGDETEIAKISLDNGVEFKNIATVKGYVDNQYSFSEKDGKLCVFTSVNGEESSKNDENFLYILDENLKEIYKSTPFAKGESIKAVKYVKDFAYVITYEETDPLFIIDLKDVKNPVFKGEVKITGFSEMLIDVGDNMLLGIGHSTHYGKEAGMEITDGIKFALFDVSNPNAPKVLDSKEYKGYSTDLFYNPKCLTVNNTDGTYSLPFYDDYGKIGALMMSVKDKKIIENKNQKFDAQGYNSRISFVDSTYYFVDVENADVTSFEF